MVNKLIRKSSKCANSVAEKSRFLKQKSNKRCNKKSNFNKTNPKLFNY